VTARSVQAQMPHNHCFGCGPSNDNGLGLESFWSSAGICTARFRPRAHHCAAPAHVVNGGVIATLIDCHAICTATAAAYRAESRPIGSWPHLYFATAQLRVRYRRPASISDVLELTAQIMQETPRGFIVECTLECRARQCVSAEVDAVRVSEQWMTADY